MKKMILALVAVFALTMSVQAQTEEKGDKKKISKEEMIQHRTDMLADSLGLTDAQKEALLALNTEYSDKMVPQGGPQGGPQRPPRMQEEGGPDEGVSPEPPSQEDRENARKETEETMENYKTALKAILTDEQYAKYEEMQKNMMRPNNKGRRGGPGKKGPREEGGEQE